MSLAEQRPREGRLHGPVSPADFYDWRREASSFSDMAAYYPKGANLTGGAEPQRIDGLRVTDGFLRILGMAPALGRDFRAEEDADGRNRVILLSDGLWRRAFGADPSVVGRRVLLDGEPYEVAGVLPAAFWWPGDPAFLTPLALDDHDRTLRGAHFLAVLGRVRPGVPEAQAREEMAIIGRRLSARYPVENTDHVPVLRPIRSVLVGDTRTALLVLLGAVAFVLLIACGNVAMLLLARALGRHRELSVRFAMGASRGRIVRQLLVESLVLSFAGGAAGLLVGHWALSGLRAILPAQFEQLPGIAAVGLDARVLAWAAGVSLASGVAFGIAPALAASDRRIGQALTEDARGAAGHARGTRIRSTLVAAELALSVVLLAGAVLLMVSFRNLMDVAPGFRPDRLVTARLTLPYSRYGTHARVTSFYAALFERLRATPGIASAAVSSAPPFSGLDDVLDLQIERRPPTPAAPPRAYPRLVSAGYFATMGIPLVRGRVFDDHDDGTGRAVVAINQTAQRRYWPNTDPIGTRIRLGDGEWMTIVGIVGDVRHGGLDAELEPEAFIPLAQGFDQLGTAYERSLTLLVRGDPNGSNPSALLRQAVAAVDPQQPLDVIRPMDALIAQSVAPYRLNLTLLGAFAFVAVVLTERRVVRRHGISGRSADARAGGADGTRCDGQAGDGPGARTGVADDDRGDRDGNRCGARVEPGHDVAAVRRQRGRSVRVHRGVGHPAGRGDVRGRGAVPPHRRDRCARRAAARLTADLRSPHPGLCASFPRSAPIILRCCRTSDTRCGSSHARASSRSSSCTLAIGIAATRSSSACRTRFSGVRFRSPSAPRPST